MLVEETIGRGEGQRWGLYEVGEYDTRDDAVEATERLAVEYQPQHPAFEKQRKIYETGDGSWAVWLRGATTEFHFRLTVAKRVTGQRKPDDEQE
ncbi:hypothetical protein ALI144C_34525 [Actinosynnema sp. ALI-1.44]|uniref:hypothetical protein n=1 Tax=Actinosynnema sp. ALI-1.44 TaxID=1933779 RepID=UPI00097BE577|nr:hypothetical protein [Actinosynnema sp. ALI-1.44]ONI77195.1 hypothetical protein ALI144C_34525 [Actinosynnema sp. ALI-1.44]